MIEQQPPKSLARVLASAVRMKLHAWSRLPPKQGHPQGIQDDAPFETLAHRPTDNAPRS